MWNEIKRNPLKKMELTWTDVRTDLIKFKDNFNVEDAIIHRIKEMCMNSFVAPENRNCTTLRLSQPILMGDQETLLFDVHCDRECGQNVQHAVLGVLIDPEGRAHTFSI